MKKIFFFTILMTLLSNAEIIDSSYQLKSKSITKKECKSGTKSTLCFNKELTYPSINILNKEVKDGLNIYINKTLLEYKKTDIDNYFEGIDLDKDELIGGGEYETINSLELFDYNQPVISISQNYYEYAGGAHGNGGREFINYDIKEKKEIELSDIVDVNNSKFLNIALMEYKKSENLLPNDSLTEAWWFDNNFTLSENFAITSNALLFHYNAYEIKPYAAGMTEFLLPYNKIKPFLKKSSISHIFKSQKKVKEINKETSSEEGRLTFNIRKEENGFYTIKVDTSIFKDIKKVWFSLSFPNFKNSDKIKVLNSSNTESFKLYKIGSELFSNKTKKTIKSEYPLLESESKSADFKLSFKVKKPKDMPYFCMNYRVTTRSKTFFKSEQSELYDQQGFQVQRVCLDLP